MKNIWLIAFGVLLLALSSCKKDDGEGTLIIEYKARVNNQTLEFNHYYLVGSDSLEFSVFKFYVSGVTIYDKENSSQLEVSPVELIDFNGGTTTFSKSLTEGDYKDLNFLLGLNNELNSTVPTDYAEEAPLGLAAGNYWLMANSYIYFKIEGFRLKNGVQEPFTYHVGLDDFYREKTLERSFTIHDGNTTTLLGLLDINDLFANIDFDTEYETHTTNNMALAVKMMDNFANALSLE